MKRYKDIWCSADYADIPEWLDVELSEVDLARVEISKQFLAEHDGDQVRFALDGKLAWPSDFVAKVRMWQLIVTPYSVWVGFCNEWSGDMYECEVGERI